MATLSTRLRAIESRKVNRRLSPAEQERGTATRALLDSLGESAVGRDRDAMIRGLAERIGSGLLTDADREILDGMPTDALETLDSTSTEFVLLMRDFNDCY